MVKLAIDAMSGDLGSSIVVDAIHDFLNKDKETQLYVCGKQEELESLKDYEQVHIVDARDILGMSEGILSVRRKKESSMVKAVTLAKEGTVDGVVSCGSTGSFYTAAYLFIPRIEGVDKSCLMAILPTYNNKGVEMLDVGANAENTAEHLYKFAVMGDVYAKVVRGIEKPKIALLNIGTEEKKGDDVHKEAFQMLSDSNMNFIGNIEGKELLKGNVDVIVTDGFTGNVAMKTLEGTATVLMKSIKDELMSTTKSKVGLLLAKDGLYRLADRFDAKAVGGALMMGFEKVVVKAHGASDAPSFETAIELARKMVEEDVVNKMKEGLQ